MALDSLIESARYSELTDKQTAILVGLGHQWGHIRTELSADDGKRTEQLGRLLHGHVVSLVDKVRSIIATSIEAPASVAIKLLLAASDGSSPVIRTFVRDSVSQDQRKRAPDAFPWTSNSAFSDIITGKEPGYFVCDDLQGLEAQGRYRNINKNWKLEYNSTAVTEIPSRRGGSNGIVGFICADSPYGKLSSAPVAKTLEITSAHLYNILGLMVTLGDHQESRELFDRGEKDFRIGWCYNVGAAVELTEIDPPRQLRLQKLVDRQRRNRIIPKAAVEAVAELVLGLPSAGGQQVSEPDTWITPTPWFPDEEPPRRPNMTYDEFEDFLQDQAKRDPIVAEALRNRAR